jgi:peptidoglycan hydrolase CwlO-like protein
LTGLRTNLSDLEGELQGQISKNHDLSGQINKLETTVKELNETQVTLKNDITYEQEKVSSLELNLD